MFSGILFYIIFTTSFQILSILILLIFKIKLNKELKKQNSNLYRIVYTLRIFFVTFGLCNMCSYLMFFYFIKNFDEMIILQPQIKIEITKSIENFSVSIDTLYYFNWAFQIFSFLVLTHEIYWHGLLDYSWVDNLEEKKISFNDQDSHKSFDKKDNENESNLDNDNKSYLDNEYNKEVIKSEIIKNY